MILINYQTRIFICYFNLSCVTQWASDLIFTIYLFFKPTNSCKPILNLHYRPDLYPCWSSGQSLTGTEYLHDRNGGDRQYPKQCYCQ